MRIKLKIAERHTEEIKITTPYIKLDSLLKFAGAAETGAFAKSLILDGKIKVNGEICTARGKKIRGGDTVSFLNYDYKVIYED